MIPKKSGRSNFKNTSDVGMARGSGRAAFPPRRASPPHSPDTSLPKGRSEP